MILLLRTNFVIFGNDSNFLAINVFYFLSKINDVDFLRCLNCSINYTTRLIINRVEYFTDNLQIVRLTIVVRTRTTLFVLQTRRRSITLSGNGRDWYTLCSKLHSVSTWKKIMKIFFKITINNTRVIRAFNVKLLTIIAAS